MAYSLSKKPRVFVACILFCSLFACFYASCLVLGLGAKIGTKRLTTELHFSYSSGIFASRLSFAPPPPKKKVKQNKIANSRTNRWRRDTRPTSCSSTRSYRRLARRKSSRHTSRKCWPRRRSKEGPPIYSTMVVYLRDGFVVGLPLPPSFCTAGLKNLVSLSFPLADACHAFAARC